MLTPLIVKRVANRLTRPLLPKPSSRRRRKARSAINSRGQNIPLSPPRRFICDLLHYAQKVPSIPMQRRMRLADVVAARAAWPQRVSWCAIFLKAYATVAAQRPELRRTFMPYPWPHLYEHPCSIATFSVERNYEGEDAVFLAQVPRPELFNLMNLDQFVRSHKTTPIEKVACYRRALRISKLPSPLRRIAWSSTLYGDGHLRARVFGTFGISVVASLGAAGLHILSPLTTTINYGTFESDGSIDVRLTYDHRVLDGAPVARAMAALEEVLHGEILEELLDGPAPIFGLDRRFDSAAETHAARAESLVGAAVNTA
jgi:hypothetical protein